MSHIVALIVPKVKPKRLTWSTQYGNKRLLLADGNRTKLKTQSKHYIYIYNRLLLAITPVVSVVCKLMRSIVEAISSPAVTSVNVAKFRLRLDDNVLRKSGKVFPHPYSSVVKMIHVHINPEK